MLIRCVKLVLRYPAKLGINVAKNRVAYRAAAHTGAGRYRPSAAGRPETGLRRLIATSPQNVGSMGRGSGRQ